MMDSITFTSFGRLGLPGILDCLLTRLSLELNDRERERGIKRERERRTERDVFEIIFLESSSNII